MRLSYKSYLKRITKCGSLLTQEQLTLTARLDLVQLWALEAGEQKRKLPPTPYISKRRGTKEQIVTFNICKTSILSDLSLPSANIISTKIKFSKACKYQFSQRTMHQPFF